MKKILLLLVVLLLSACSKVDTSKGGPSYEDAYPKDPRDRLEDRRGKLSGEGGLSLFGNGSGEESGGVGNSLPVNSFLWRATLDTISFVPLSQADPASGVILTDWYENPEVKGERYKINVLILDKKLRTDALRVSVFRQVFDKTRNAWRDDKANDKTARELEDKILARARELRISQLPRSN